MEHYATAGTSWRNAASGVHGSFGSLHQQARDTLRVPVTRLSEILNERRSITADTALRLERYFGMSADFWLNVQRRFDLISARQALGKQIEAEVRPRDAA